MRMVKPILEGREQTIKQAHYPRSHLLLCKQGLVEMPFIVNDDRIHVATCDRVGRQGKATTVWL